MRSVLTVAAALVLVGASTDALAQGGRNHVLAVGSSTLFPFVSAVAEHFGRTTDFATPVVEGMGTGGGFRLFCRGVGLDTADIANASRRVTRAEIEHCTGNGVDQVVELKFGYDGLMIANSREGPAVDFTLRDIFLALAKEVPDPEKAGELILNPYQRWNQINPELPDLPIDMIGPSPVHGTRDAFVELGMEAGCREFDWLAELAREDRDLFRDICHTVREDGVFMEASGSYNVIVQRLRREPNQFGILGFNFVEQNREALQPALINGVEATEDNVIDGSYPLARSLYLYIKPAHLPLVQGLEEFVLAFVGDRANGDAGFLVDRGLIPLTDEQLEEARALLKDMTPLDIAELN